MLEYYFEKWQFELLTKSTVVASIVMRSMEGALFDVWEHRLSVCVTNYPKEPASLSLFNQYSLTICTFTSSLQIELRNQPLSDLIQYSLTILYIHLVSANRTNEPASLWPHTIPSNHPIHIHITISHGPVQDCTASTLSLISVSI